MISTLSIIVPAYNEESTIEEILSRIQNTELENKVSKEIIVVDDASTDSTVSIIQSFISKTPEANVKLILNKKNQGKGFAIRQGFNYCTGEYLIVQDADLEYDPQEYNLLLKPVFKGMADVVFGSRFVGGRPHRMLFFWHTIGNKFLTLISNMFTNLNLSDMETCYKLISTEIIRGITLTENRFGFEPEVTAKIAKIKGIRIYEVGISYYGRTYKEGKKISWRDAFRAIYCIIKYSFS